MIVPSVIVLKICSWKLDFWCCFISQVAYYHILAPFSTELLLQPGLNVKTIGKTYHIINRLSDTLLPLGKGDTIFKVQSHHANDLTQWSHPCGLNVPCLGPEWFKTTQDRVLKSVSCWNRWGWQRQPWNCQRIIASVPAYHYSLRASQGSH